ncbi:MAG: hypothetical protein C0433_07420 [Cyclobacterium sp.]|nr:hypothetical protein [Cyclobacterium sp.]
MIFSPVFFIQKDLDKKSRTLISSLIINYVCPLSCQKQNKIRFEVPKNELWTVDSRLWTIIRNFI